MSRSTEAASALDHGIRPAGYRLPAETRIGRVRLQVSDLERSLAWYGGVLGLRTLERQGGEAVLGPLEEDRALVQLVEDRSVRPVPQHGRLGLYHFAILLPERAALGSFVAHLAARGERAGASDHKVSEALYLYDPDGLGIEVYADRPRSSWQWEGRQLRMATDPLDVRSLTRAAAGRPWQGMPAGTVIGHVHLHVGDLARAEAFYHGGLGLDKVVWNYPGALFLSAGGYHHHLGLNTWAAGAPPAGAGDARLLEWELMLPAEADVREALASLEAAGVGEAGGGGEPARDPWGTAVRVRAAPAP